MLRPSPKFVWNSDRFLDDNCLVLKGSVHSHRQQECIPVGCVPAARWPYAGVCFPGGVLSLGGVSSGGCLLQGVSALGGVCYGGCLLLGGVCSGGVCSGGVCSQGVSAPRGVVSAPRGGLLPGSVCSQGVVSAPRGVCSQGGLLPGGVCSGGCLLRGGVCSGGCLLPGEWCLLPGGGVCSQGVSALGYLLPGGCVWYLSMHGGRHPPCEQNEWQTGVKILPWPQLRCGR